MHCELLRVILNHLEDDDLKIDLLNVQNLKGQSPLHQAAVFGHKEFLTQIYKFTPHNRFEGLMKMRDQSNCTVIEEATTDDNIHLALQMLGDMPGEFKA